MSAAPIPSVRQIVAPGLAAVRAYWAPFLLIQAMAAALVIAYYQSPALRAIAETPAAWKAHYGFLFSFVGGFVAGGLVAELAKAVTGRIRRFDRTWLGLTVFTGTAYGLTGIQVDVLYWVQSEVFGHGTDWKTLALKTVADMSLFAPFISMPFMISLYEWREGRYSLNNLCKVWKSAFYRTKVLPTLIPCWSFWIPMVLCTYSLPLKLQLPFALLGEAAWSVLFVFIALDVVEEREGPSR